MRRLCLLFLLVAFKFSSNNAIFAQQICKDSSFINSYYLSNKNLILEDRILTADNGTLALISTLPDNPLKAIVKLSPQGIIEWNKAFISSEMNAYFLIAKFIELKDGSYVIGGVIHYSDESKPSYFVLIKLDDIGNLIWQKCYKNNYGSTVHDVLKIHSINEGDDGDIIALIFQQSSPQWNNGRSITRFSSDGRVVWSNQYIGKGLFVQNSTNVFRNEALHFWGRTYGATNCDGLSYIRIDYSSGKTDTVVKFCTPSGQQNIQFFVTDGGDDQDVMTKRLANGNTIVFSYYKTLGKELVISEFDSQMHFLRGKLFSPPDLGAVAKMPNYTFDANYSTGEVVFNSFYQQKSFPYDFLPFSYFVYLDSNLNLKQQIVLPLNAGDSYWGGVKFLHNNHLSYVSNSNQAENPVYKQFSYAEVPENVTSDAFCNAKDSLYGSFSDHVLFPINDIFKWDQIKPNIYSLNGHASLVMTTLPIQKTTVCKKISICDTLKILGSSDYCLNDGIITFHAYKNPVCFKKIEWQTDTSLATIVEMPNDTTVVLNIKKPGVFTLFASLENCVVKDSMQITINKPETVFSIVKDSLLCPGKTLLLKSTEGFASYTWQNDSSDSNYLMVSKPGSYKVTAVDRCGNIFKDSIQVKVINTDFPLSNENSICLSDTLHIALPATATKFNWSPFDNGLLQNNELLFFPEKTSSYEIMANFPGDCQIKKVIDIRVTICPETIFFPNVFTPNNDQLNDIFKPILGRPLKYYYLSIYNRFGQQVFVSKSPSAGWDGKVAEMPQNMGVFAWHCVYQFPNKEIKKLRGTVLLLK